MKVLLSNNTDAAITVYYSHHPEGIARQIGEQVETAYIDRIFKFTKGALIMEAHLYHGHYKVTNEGVVGGETSYGKWVDHAAHVVPVPKQMTINIENTCPYPVDVTFKRKKVETFSLKSQEGKLGTDYNARVFEMRNSAGKIMKYVLHNGSFVIDTIGLRGKYEPDPKRYFIKWNAPDQSASKIVQEAKKWFGAKYVWGGNDPKKGIDCSGLTKYVYKAAVNIKLPRTADQQWRNGPGKQVKTSELVPGDLVFFGTSKKATHAGIYVGENNVLSAESGKSMKVKTSKIKAFGNVLGGRHVV